MDTVMGVALALLGLNVLVVSALLVHYVRERRAEDDHDDRLDHMVDLACRFETFRQRRGSVAA
jgi:hypothetical protein